MQPAFLCLPEELVWLVVHRRLLRSKVAPAAAAASFSAPSHAAACAAFAAASVACFSLTFTIRTFTGGGPAGLSAALILGRARRRVVVFDSGEKRNEVRRR